MAVEQQGDRASEAPASPAKKQWKLPPYLDHFNLHDGKILFRCSAAVWIALLMVYIEPVLQNLQLAAFFGALLLFIVPPANQFFAYLLAALSLLFGMCVAWAWGLATMKAALAARSAEETQRLLGETGRIAAQQAQQTGNSPAFEAQVVIHNGIFLNAKVTTIFYVMGCVFIYLLARIRFANHKFVPLQLFGTIVTDIFILIGPTLPSFTPDLGSILVKPGAVGVALGAACCLFLFPHSTSYLVLDKLEKLVRLNQISISATTKRLNKQDITAAELSGSKVKVIGLYKATEPLLSFLPLDFSRGRWDADDVKAVQGPIREAMLANLTLVDFHIMRINAQDRESDLQRHPSQLEKQDVGLHQQQETADLMEALRNAQYAHVQDRTREALLETTGDLISECSASVKLAAKCINTVNTRRWIHKPTQQEFDNLADQLKKQLETLDSTRKECVERTTEKILETHQELFDDDGNMKAPFAGGPALQRSLVIAMVIEERILGLALALAKVQQEVLRLISSRRTHRIWWPSRLRYALHWVLDTRSALPISGTPAKAEDDPETATINDKVVLHDEAAKEAWHRLNVSRGTADPIHRRSAFTQAAGATVNWLTGPAGMYAIRMVVVTIATSIPAAIPHSAGFFYREKGIWGVISAQTCLLPYMADFTFSVLCRGLGTVFGGVLGMVAWYIGSGSGPGNPYGLAAISAVMVVILMWLRIFLPPQYAQASIMAGATFVLVIGFSYDTHHIVQYGLPGVGYEAFWKRLVTVLLGFVASCVVQLLPRPPSATKHVCKTLGNTVGTLADHYALILSHWVGPENRSEQNGQTGQTGQDENVDGEESRGMPNPLSIVAEKISLDVGDTLLGLNGSIALLKIEASFGPFHHNNLREVQRLCLSMNQSLGLLLSLATTMPKHLQERFSKTVGFTDDHVIGDVMAVLSVVDMSLKTGSAVPERLPTPLTRNFYKWWHQQHRTAILTRDLVRDENYRRFCVAVSAYLRFLAAVDDLILVIKGAVGESHVVRQWDV